MGTSLLPIAQKEIRFCARSMCMPLFMHATNNERRSNLFPTNDIRVMYVRNCGHLSSQNQHVHLNLTNKQSIQTFSIENVCNSILILLVNAWNYHFGNEISHFVCCFAFFMIPILDRSIYLEAINCYACGFCWNGVFNINFIASHHFLGWILRFESIIRKK